METEKEKSKNTQSIITVLRGSSFGELVIIKNSENKINNCNLCKYSGKSNDKLPCSWCSDYIGQNGYYR
jgi:hypothetical protein